MRAGARLALVLGGVSLIVCGGFMGSIFLSFPASQGARIDGGDIVGIETGGAYAWVVPSASGVLLVDAGMDPEATALKAEIAGRPVRAVFVTHGHLDHVAGLASLGADRALVGPGESDLASGTVGAKSMMPRLFGSLMGYPEGLPDLEELKGDDRLFVDGVEVKALHLPGHTAGSMAYVIGDVVFTGDAALGHTDHVAPVHGAFTEDMGRATESLKKLEGVATRMADGHAGLHTDLPTKLANSLH